MNTIAGMLRMQARRAKDDDTKEALRRAVSRILGISQIHDILASQSGDKIDMDILLDKLPSYPWTAWPLYLSMW